MEGGLADALKLIQETAQKAQVIQAVDDIEVRNATMFDVNGQIVIHPDSIPARQHSASDIDSLASLVEAYGDSEEASVWHSGNSVIAVLNGGSDSYRDDKVLWLLTESTKWKVLTRDAGIPRAHAEFVRFLVQNLRDEIDAAAPGLMGTIRSLKFRAADEQNGNIQQGRESVSRSIESEISGADKLPETVIIRVRRWASLDYVGAVECLLVLDTNDRKLSLRPLADQLEQAENSAQEWLATKLGEHVDCPVYYGTP